MNNNNLKSLTQLSNLRPGEEGIVAFIRAGNKASQRILDMGLTRGTRIRVLESAPFHGPIKIKVRNTSLVLGRGLAGRVFIRVI